MNDIVTYYQPKEPIHTLRPLVPAIEIEGQLSPGLELLEICRSAGPDLNKATFRIIGTEGGPAGRFEEIETVLQPGHAVGVYQRVPADAASGAQRAWPLFEGVLSGGVSELTGRSESVELTAVDALVFQDSLKLFQSDDMAVFNDGNQPNRSAFRQTINGIETFVFEGDPLQAKFWSIADAALYLAAAGFSREALPNASVKLLELFTEGLELKELGVSGLSPLNALDKICKLAGVGFYSESISLHEDAGKTLLSFYRHRQGRKVRLAHQSAGENLDLQKTNLAEINLQEDSDPIHCAGSATLPYIRSDIQPGHVIKGIAGRDVSFQRFLHDQTPLPQITEVILRFGEAWTTTIHFK